MGGWRAVIVYFRYYPDILVSITALTWMGFTAQRVSCALARAVAWELASAMELTRVRDARDDD